jgi:hypothetical protein
MAKLFVSYSRKDAVAAHKLIEAFKSIQQDVWVDWESIPPAVDWLEQIFRGIEESDAFIFLISPDSIASEVCKVEINRAAQNNKRIIPIVLRDVQPKDSPENIRKLNWTFIRETDNFEEGLAKVKTAIELDLDWLEEHRRLQVRSLEWHRKKEPSLLLRGRDLRNARHMIATATAKDPIPTDLQKIFIDYSRRSERNRIVTLTATGFAVIALAVLSFLATQARELRRGISRSSAIEEASKTVAVTAQAEEAIKDRSEEAQKRNEDGSLSKMRSRRKPNAAPPGHRSIKAGQGNSTQAPCLPSTRCEGTRLTKQRKSFAGISACCPSRLHSSRRQGRSTHWHSTVKAAASSLAAPTAQSVRGGFRKM